MRSEKSLIVESWLARCQLLLAESGLDAAGRLAAAEGLFIHLRSQANSAVLSESDGLVSEMREHWAEAAAAERALRLVEN